MAAPKTNGQHLFDRGIATRCVPKNQVVDASMAFALELAENDGRAMTAIMDMIKAVRGDKPLTEIFADVAPFMNTGRQGPPKNGVKSNLQLLNAYKTV